jgi:TolB-like protein
VTTHLTNKADGIEIWSKQFDESTDELFTTKDKIAKTLAEELKFSMENFDGNHRSP